MMPERSPMLPHVDEGLPRGLHWFGMGGGVMEIGEEVEVTVHGVLVGRYHREDIGARNAVLVGLAAEPRMPLGPLARAFGLSEEMLRKIRRRHEEGGVEAVQPRPGRKVDEGLRSKLEALFAAGLTITATHQRIRRRHRISRATVGIVHKQWVATQLVVPPGEARPPDTGAAANLDEEPRVGRETGGTAAAPPDAPSASVADSSSSASARASEPDRASGRAPVTSASSAAFVQHVGSWLLVGAVGKYGLHDVATEVCAKHDLVPSAMRVALDAFTIALATGESTVEGVRRVATPTAPKLLRVPHAPSADWVRSTVAQFAGKGASDFHFGMAARYLAAARALDEEVVFYVDNHLRPYSGKETLRKGWRMQEKRVLPGTSDYYVHDEDGRPVLRFVAPDHGHLTDFLLPVADTLQSVLGEDARILLCFDRAGAFPEMLASLRDESVAFVTYERRPYRALRPAEFTEELVLVDEDGEPERLRYVESWIALGKGRGDVKRIAILTEEGRQVNLLCKAQASAARLIEVMRGRWRQENGFKHGVERWGINQLDGRSTVAYAPTTVIPNPARRRLDNALRLACVDEGLARRELALRAEDDAKREHFERAVADAIARQRELMALRATTPARAPLSETELAGKLVHHVGTYKTVLDTVRVACANAEADLAAHIAPELPQAREAKKALANLFAAPGAVRLTRDAVRVELAPAATAPERAAYARFFAKINAAALRLPEDSAGRRLHFEAQP